MKWFWQRNLFIGSVLALLLPDPLVLSPNLLSRRQLLCSNTCASGIPSLAPHLLKSQMLQPAVRGKDQRSSTCTGIFSTKSASAQITLHIKRFSHKCAYVIELITSFLRVINKHTVSKVWKGQGRENRQQDMEQKKLKIYKNLSLSGTSVLQWLPYTGAPQEHTASKWIRTSVCTKPAAIVSKGPSGTAEVKCLQR